MEKRKIGWLVIGLLLSLTGIRAGVWAGGWGAETARQLEQRLRLAAASEVRRCGDPRFDLHAALMRFYGCRGFEPAWVDRYGLRPEGAMALAAVSQAGSQGLRYADYQDPWLEDLLDGMLTRPVIIGSSFEGKQIQLDLVITTMVLRYAWHCAEGRIAADMLGIEPPSPKATSLDLAMALAKALRYQGLEDFFMRLGPNHAAYRALRRSLPRYLRIQRSGGWPTITSGPALQLGGCGPRVAQLRNRLVASGDVPLPAELREHCFDDELATAVASFQRRHGLHPDGVAGKRTLAALNVPVEQRIHQIQLSLERWRWLPADLGSRYVLVNIPGFEMQVVEAGQVVKTMRTIVGRKRRPTPAFASLITYLEINPYWYVPPKIAREDLLPKIQKDPGFLMRQNFRVFDGWQKDAREIDPTAIDWASLSKNHFPWQLRQEPAAFNALGRVKFIFPNPWSVYIHDTPAKGLFRKSSRPFSSGCVRVEEPVALMSLLLKPQGWDPERLSEAVISNQRQVV
ncbi:MAG: L,D-transpeptidase family protein, partial [Desulfobacterales bacterium]